MKITKEYLKNIIKEELSKIEEVGVLTPETERNVINNLQNSLNLKMGPDGNVANLEKEKRDLVTNLTGQFGKETADRLITKLKFSKG